MLSTGGRSCPVELAGSQWGQGCGSFSVGGGGGAVQPAWQVWVWCEEATGLGELGYTHMV